MTALVERDMTRPSTSAPACSYLNHFFCNLDYAPVETFVKV